MKKLTKSIFVLGLMSVSSSFAFKPAYEEYGHTMITRQVLEGTYDFNKSFYYDLGSSIPRLNLILKNNGISNFKSYADINGFQFGSPNSSIDHIVLGAQSRDKDNSIALNCVTNKELLTLLAIPTASTYALALKFQANLLASFDATLYSDGALSVDSAPSEVRCVELIDGHLIQYSGDLFFEYAHCDNDKVIECSKAIRFYRRKAIDWLLMAKNAKTADEKQKRVIGARLFIGKALHTVQDFYAHSNWVDGDRENPSSETYYPKNIFSELTGKINGEFHNIESRDFLKALIDKNIRLSVERAATEVCSNNIQSGRFSTLRDNDGNYYEHINSNMLTTGYFNNYGTGLEGKSAATGVLNNKCDHGFYQKYLDVTLSGIAKDTPYSALRASGDSYSNPILRDQFRVGGYYGTSSSPQDTYTSIQDAANESSPEHLQASYFAAKHTRHFIQELVGIIQSEYSEATADEMVNLLTGQSESGNSPETVLLFDMTGSQADAYKKIIELFDKECPSTKRSGVCSEKNHKLVSLSSEELLGLNGEVRGEAPIVKTEAVGTFSEIFQKLKTLSPKGGGDCSEPVYGAMIQTMKEMKYGGVLHVFTDAKPSDPDLLSEMQDIADKKGILPIFDLIGSCSPIDPSYFQSASQSGGQVRVLDATEEGMSALFNNTTTSPNGFALKLAHYESSIMPTASRSVTVPVDSAATTLQVSLNTFGGTLKLLAPNGAEMVAGGDVKVSSTVNTMGISVDNPTIGDWQIVVTPNANATGVPYTLSANIGGGPTLAGLTYRHQIEVGRAMHEYSPEVTGTPPAVPLRVQIAMYPAVASANMQYVSTDGNVLSATPLTQSSPGQWQTLATPPQQMHRVRVVGIDTAGKAFERMFPVEQAKSVVTGGIFRVTPVNSFTVTPGKTSTVQLLIQNMGTDDDFTTTVDSSSVGTPVMTNANGRLAGQASGVITVSIAVPAGYTGSATDAIKLTVGGPNGRAALALPIGVAQTPATVQTTFTGPTATGTGNATATVSGGGSTCGFASSQFVAPTNAPVGKTFPHGVFDFVLQGCNPGSTVTVNVVYPSALPAGAQYWKYGKTADYTLPHWYTYSAALAGNSASFSITDGAAGDDDRTANGQIVDPGGPVVNAVADDIAAVPTLSEWGILMLAGLMGLLGLGQTRRRIRASA